MKDSLGLSSDAHSAGVRQIGTPEQHIAQQNKLAIQDKEQRMAIGGGNWGVSKSILPSGHALFTSVAPKQANSRGARRGAHEAITHSIRAPGEQYSKRVTVNKIAEHWKKKP